MLHLRRFVSIPNAAAQAQPFILISCQEVSLSCCTEIMGRQWLHGKEVPPEFLSTGTQRGRLCPLSHLGYGLSPWVPLPSAAKALHDYETMAADKNPWLRERSIVGSHIISQIFPNESLWLSKSIKSCHRLFVGCRAGISLAKIDIASLLGIIL